MHTPSPDPLQKPLPKALKKRWLKALESGKYAKGKESLRIYDARRKTESFCCLGVLADTEYVGKWDGDVLITLEGELVSSAFGVDRWDEIGNSDACALGLLTGRTRVNLTVINDDDRDFKRVCAYIRRYL